MDDRKYIRFNGLIDIPNNLEEESVMQNIRLFLETNDCYFEGITTLNENNNKIYTITGVSPPRKNGDTLSFIRNCYGFYFNLEKAMNEVEVNASIFIHKLYEYVVIEEYQDGVHYSPKQVVWYKYKKDINSYIMIDAPEWSKENSSWSKIGE